MATPPPVYDRAPSEELKKLLLPSGFLSPLVELAGKRVGRHYHDVHFRTNDEMDIYRGRTTLVVVTKTHNNKVNVTARDSKYRKQLCSEGIFRYWRTSESGFREALNQYLKAVDVSDSYTQHEGRVQLQWSRVKRPWIPIDREARLKYKSTKHREQYKVFPKVEAALDELTRNYDRQKMIGETWSEPEAKGNKVDQLAVDTEGRLVLLELKDASKRNTKEVYYSPFQLLQYVWEWYTALEAVRNDLQAIIDARVKVGLTPRNIPKLTGGIRAAIGFGLDSRTPEVKRRYRMVVNVANKHLPDDVGPIETWEYTDTGPSLVT
jgi:hypothetical protein